MLRKVIIGLSIFYTPINSLAEGVKVNTGDITDPKVLFVNSGAIGLQNSMFITVGYEIYHMGVTGNALTNGFTAFSYPACASGSLALVDRPYTSEGRLYR